MESPKCLSRASLVVKNLPSNAGDKGSIPGSGRSPGEGTSDILQYSSSLWEIPRTEEPGRPIGSQRVEHDLMTQQQHRSLSIC